MSVPCLKTLCSSPSPACRGFKGPPPFPHFSPSSPPTDSPHTQHLTSLLFPELSRHIDRLPMQAVRHPPVPGAPRSSFKAQFRGHLLGETYADSPPPMRNSHPASTLSSTALLTLLGHHKFQAIPSLTGSSAGEQGQTQGLTSNASACISQSSGHPVSFNLITCDGELRVAHPPHFNNGNKELRNMTCLAQRHRIRAELGPRPSD